MKILVNLAGPSNEFAISGANNKTGTGVNLASAAGTVLISNMIDWTTGEPTGTDLVMVRPFGGAHLLPSEIATSPDDLPAAFYCSGWTGNASSALKVTGLTPGQGFILKAAAHHNTWDSRDTTISVVGEETSSLLYNKTAHASPFDPALVPTPSVVLYGIVPANGEVEVDFSGAGSSFSYANGFMLETIDVSGVGQLGTTVLSSTSAGAVYNTTTTGGTVYAIAVASTASPVIPTPAQIMAYTDGSGNPAVGGSLVTGVAGTYTVPITGLTKGKKYRLYAFHRAADGVTNSAVLRGEVVPLARVAVQLVSDNAGTQYTGSTTTNMLVCGNTGNTIVASEATISETGLAELLHPSILPNTNYVVGLHETDWSRSVLLKVTSGA